MIKITIDGNRVVIDGEIRSQSNYGYIRAILEELKSQGKREIKLVFTDTHIILSSLIGYLMKVKNIDDISLTMEVQNKEAYTMLEDMNLLDVLAVCRV